MAEIRISQDCLGVGQCVLTAPDLFTLGEDGLSSVDPTRVSPATLERARAAAANCPTGAIEIIE